MQAPLVKTIIATSLDAIVCADEQGSITLWNPAAERMFGYAEAEAIGQPLTIILREEDRAAHEKGISQFLKTGEGALIGKVTETMGLRKDGSAFPKEMSLSTEKVEGKWIFTAIMRDITERWQAEEALRQSQQSLLQAQYIAQMGNFTWDIQSGHVAWSLGMHRLLKYDENEQIDYNRVNRDIHHPDDLEWVTEWLQNGIASGEKTLVPQEYRLICKDGEVIWVRTNGMLEYENGQAVGLIGTCQNITERKHTEQQLQSLLEIGRKINASLDQATIRKILVAAACSLMNAESGASGTVEDGHMIFREYRQNDQWAPIDYTFEPGFG
ncbi:MAG: PAS domain S-box protein, partial [Mariprofundus sp.]|nr:PAS domain S-box protein [Mariprofundus sp.]